MAYRDVLFGPLTSVFVVSGLSSEVNAALPHALQHVALSRRAVGRRWSGDGTQGPIHESDELSALVSRSIHSIDEHDDDAALVAAAHRTGLSGLPIAVTRAGDRLALLFAHSAFDGSGSLQIVHDLLDAASGRALTVESAPARLPMLQALRQIRPAHVRQFVEARRGRPQSPAVTSTTARATSAAFSLDAADLKAIRRYREPDRVGRATLLSRLASLIVAALREVAVDDVDVPVWMTSDLRHLVDGRVDGNFITRELIGTLHGDQWAPCALAARMVRLKEPGQALALVWGPTGWLLRSALGKKPTAGEEIVLTLATTQRSFPVPVRSVLATSIGGSPTFGFALQTKDSVYVSVYDSSGRFDLDRFEGVFRRIVEERGGVV